MKITVFDGFNGDALLFQSDGGKNILVDGGRVIPRSKKVDSYSRNIAATMGELREAGENLDLVCVSHIDQDHIGGIIRMLDDEFEWRVFEYQNSQGLAVEQPSNPRPPQILSIWHNSFHEQLNMNFGDIEDAIAAAAPASLAIGSGPESHGKDLFNRLATSMKEAAMLSRRIGARQLGIALNTEFEGKLVQRKTGTVPINLDDVTITVLGPNRKRLTDLRKKWKSWLKSAGGRKAIGKVRKNAEEDENALINGDFDEFLELADLGPAVGRRSTVTKQNVASIILMLEENGKKMLVTGDARDDDIVEDLIDTGFADSDGHLHVDVLKIQHHGSENNFSMGFAQRITADHYLFCGNGEHENPDLRVVQQVIDSRVGTAAKRSQNPKASQKFKLWFTSNGDTPRAEKHHMKKLMEEVKNRQIGFENVMDYHFSDDSHFIVEI